MLELDKLKKILDAEVATGDFMLDPRTPQQRLENIAGYSDLIPFASNQIANWGSFWLKDTTAQALADIYKSGSFDAQTLPVQQTFLLALLQLLETPGLLLNTLPARHRLLYYRDLLGFSPRSALPDSVAVSFSLQSNTEDYLLPAGTALDGGQDSAGNTLTYLTDELLLITPQQLSRLCWTRHSDFEVSTVLDVENGITLPDDGIRLLSKTGHEERSAVRGQSIYLGFSDVKPGETLSLYWSLDGSSPLDLTWSYYTLDKKWASLAAGVQDSTGGLSGSGLWRAVLPDDSAPGTDAEADIFPNTYYWLRAGIELSDHVSKLRGVFSGAVTATLDTTGDIDDSHFAQALPADTINQLTTPQPEISSVSQPLPSSGGRAPETEAAMIARAATRISHRQRAISWGNMRSMLMDNYPQLFDVRFPDAEKLNHIPAPVTQTLLAIPDSRYRDNDDALRPTLSAVRLSAMTAWLKQYASLWVEPVVLNPIYIDVTAAYKVVFIDGISPDYGYSQLNSWLQQRYMPWGEDQQQAVTPGNQLDYYQLLATIQQSPMVQRVLSLTLKRPEKDAKEQQQTISAGENEVLILVPVPRANNTSGELYV